MSSKLATPTLRLRLQSVRYEAEDIHSFELVHPQGELLPEVQAGAHLEVHLPDGKRRSYSLAGDPADRLRWVLGVLREIKGQGGSRAMHDVLRVGDVVTVSGPHNAFALQPHAHHTLLLAAGIGVTPLKAMAHALAARAQSFSFHYCARHPAKAAFVTTLQAIVPKGHLHLYYDNGHSEQGLDLAALLHEVLPETQVYYCGPPSFMQACAKASAHWPAGSVSCEYFKEPMAQSDLALSPQPGSSRVEFEVHLIRSGRVIEVLANQSIVRAIELAGYRIPTSCLSGMCGACKVTYLEGEVAHNDYILTDEEQRSCLTTCVSRALSRRLVLDL